MSDDLAALATLDTVRLFVGREESDALLTERSRELHDVHTLRSLTSGDVSFVVTHAGGAIHRLPSPDTVRTEALVLETGTLAGFQETISTLNKFHFDRCDIVEKPGEYAVRGGIVDVFPFVGENPIRIEFFEDEVESIREFDVGSQRSIRSLSTALLVPDVLDTELHDHAQDGILLDYLADGALLVFLEPLLHDEPLTKLPATASGALPHPRVLRGDRRPLPAAPLHGAGSLRPAPGCRRTSAAGLQRQRADDGARHRRTTGRRVCRHHHLRQPVGDGARA